MIVQKTRLQPLGLRLARVSIQRCSTPCQRVQADDATLVAFAMTNIGCSAVWIEVRRLQGEGFRHPQTSTPHDANQSRVAYT
jgi:hypothetical protein